MRPNGNGHNRDAATSRVAVTRTADAAQPERTGGIQFTNTVNPLLLTIPETCATLRLSRATIYRLIAANELRTVHQGRAVRITTASVAAWVARASGEPVQLPTPTNAEAASARPAASLEVA